MKNTLQDSLTRIACEIESLKEDACIELDFKNLIKALNDGLDPNEIDANFGIIESDLDTLFSTVGDLRNEFREIALPEQYPPFINLNPCL